MENEKSKLLNYNLQIFAEGGTEPEPTPNQIQQQEPIPAPNNEPEPMPTLTVEEEVSKMMARIKVLEKAKDNACSDAAEWKKKYRSTLDEKTALDLEKAEREAERETQFETLKREVSINKMAKSFITLGYSESEADKASNAQLDNDFDELTRIQKAVQERQQKEYLAKYMKTQPIPPGGNDADNAKDAFLKGFNG